VARLVASDEPRRYRRSPAGSQLDPLLDMTIEAFLEGHARAFEWLGSVPRECVYDNLRSVVSRREGAEVIWNRRFLHLRGHYGFHASACTPATPREKGSVEAAVRYLKTGFWPARHIGSLAELESPAAVEPEGVVVPFTA
jgi:transposase